MTITGEVGAWNARENAAPAVTARGLTKVYGRGDTAVHALEG